MFRFLRCQQWLDFLLTKPASYINLLGMPRAATLYPYTDADFDENAIVTDLDFQFAEMLSSDDTVTLHKFCNCKRAGKCAFMPKCQRPL